eukprot:TRINITY_DN29158_c0_g1_i1.p1 TRINITY_DN29158_c0_g1~~TRINITY_DN29158_c0_g1_i1.p1  ORF type:complete len:348 (+),score=78.54 TRINITY_DN29158_c0_g1_i1:58-1101(+)
MASVLTRMFWRILAIQLVAALQPKELEQWLTSPTGLALSQADAEKVVHASVSALSQCGVGISQLQALKNVMYDHNGMDLDLPTLQLRVLPFAEHHVSPDKVQQLYQALSTGYTISGGLGLPKQQAQTMTLDLAWKRAEPDQLKMLYKVMYGYHGLGFDQKLAQQTAIELATAGSDANAYKAAYSQALSHGSSPADAREAAARAAVAADLDGLVRRYAKDAQPYTAEQFMQYYHANWLSEWTSGPLEKHVSLDGRAYSANQFSRHWSNWHDKYQSSPEAVQLRLAQDGKPYTMKEFQQYYSNTWQEFWAQAPELACKQCAPYAEASLSYLAVAEQAAASRARTPEVVV